MKYATSMNNESVVSYIAPHERKPLVAEFDYWIIKIACVTIISKVCGISVAAKMNAIRYVVYETIYNKYFKISWTWKKLHYRSCLRTLCISVSASSVCAHGVIVVFSSTLKRKTDASQLAS